MIVVFDGAQRTTFDPLVEVHTGAEFSDDNRSACHTIQYSCLGLPEAGEFTGVISYRVEVLRDY